MIFGLLGPYDLGGVSCVLVFVYGLARLRNRKVTLGFGKGSITIEDVHSSVEEIKKTVGHANGDGDLAQMAERGLAESAETKKEVAALREQLDLRTHVLRAGAAQPVELGPYMQEWFHDINSSLTVFIASLAILWQKLSRDYDLPDLPSMKKPDPSRGTE